MTEKPRILSMIANLKQRKSPEFEQHINVKNTDRCVSCTVRVNTMIEFCARELAR